MELKLKLVTTSPGGWWVGGWTKTKLMLFSTQVEVVVELKLELSLAIKFVSKTILVHRNGGAEKFYIHSRKSLGSRKVLS